MLGWMCERSEWGFPFILLILHWPFHYLVIADCAEWSLIRGDVVCLKLSMHETTDSIAVKSSYCELLPQEVKEEWDKRLEAFFDKSGKTLAISFTGHMKKDCITYHMKLIIINLEKYNIQPENQINIDMVIRTRVIIMN